MLLTVCLYQSQGLAQAKPETTATTETAEASAPETAPLKQTLPNQPLITQEHIAAQAEADEAAWLSTASGKFLGLYEQAKTGYPQGAVLILHAEGEHLNWHSNVQFLRLNLPERGWATLTIALPDPALPATPARPASAPASTTTTEAPADTAASATDPAASDDSTAPATPAPPPAVEMADKPMPKENPEVVAQERLTAALNYLHEQGQFNLALIGSGVNAARAAYFVRKVMPDPKAIKDNRDKTFQAMIFLNARNSLPFAATDGPQPSLPEPLIDPAMPILDLYFGTDIRDKKDTKQRLDHARRKKYRTYQQLQLPETAATSGEANALVLRRIRGFLQRHMQGMELPSSSVNQR